LGNQKLIYSFDFFLLNLEIIKLKYYHIHHRIFELNSSIVYCGISKISELSKLIIFWTYFRITFQKIFSNHGLLNLSIQIFEKWFSNLLVVIMFSLNIFSSNNHSSLKCWNWIFFCEEFKNSSWNYCLYVSFQKNWNSPNDVPSFKSSTFSF
jgi:hypothetical protein